MAWKDRKAKKSTCEEYKDFIVSLANLLYKIDLDDKDKKLLWKSLRKNKNMLKSMDMYVSDCSFQQEAALRSVMPFLKIAPSLEKKARRNVLTSGAASTYMFTSYRLLSPATDLKVSWASQLSQESSI